MKIKNLNNKRGYTLIELLVVIVILIVVGGIVISILVSSLRGSTRSTNVNEVRQGGNYILSQMSKMIAYSMVFNGVSTDGITYTTNCVPPSAPPAGTPTPTPAVYRYIKITSFDEGSTVFSCDGNPLKIASNGASMVDDSNYQIIDCSFSCTQQSFATPPILDLNFTLSKISSGIFVENNVSIPFETSVTPRNTNK